MPFHLIANRLCAAFQTMISLHEAIRGRISYIRYVRSRDNRLALCHTFPILAFLCVPFTQLSMNLMRNLFDKNLFSVTLILVSQCLHYSDTNFALIQIR